MPPATPDDLDTFLARLGIHTTTVRHPPLFTVEESRALRGDIAGGHTKNLFLKDKKGALFLVVAGEEAVLDLGRLHGLIGASGRVSFARADVLLERLGVTPGSVTPFALINDQPPTVTVILDAGLMANEFVNCHPLVNTATMTIRSADLIAFLRATGHEPRILSIATGASAAAL